METGTDLPMIESGLIHVESQEMTKHVMTLEGVSVIVRDSQRVNPFHLQEKAGVYHLRPESSPDGNHLNPGPDEKVRQGKQTALHTRVPEVTQDHLYENQNKIKETLVLPNIGDNQNHPSIGKAADRRVLSVGGQPEMTRGGTGAEISPSLLLEKQNNLQNPHLESHVRSPDLQNDRQGAGPHLLLSLRLRKRPGHQVLSLLPDAESHIKIPDHLPEDKIGADPDHLRSDPGDIVQVWHPHHQERGELALHPKGNHQALPNPLLGAQNEKGPLKDRVARHQLADPGVLVLHAGKTYEENHLNGDIRTDRSLHPEGNKEWQALQRSQNLTPHHQRETCGKSLHTLLLQRKMVEKRPGHRQGSQEANPHTLPHQERAEEFQSHHQENLVAALIHLVLQRIVLLHRHQRESLLLLENLRKVLLPHQGEDLRTAQYHSLVVLNPSLHLRRKS